MQFDPKQDQDQLSNINLKLEIQAHLRKIQLPNDQSLNHSTLTATHPNISNIKKI
jgi:hypothetical protein